MTVFKETWVHLFRSTKNRLTIVLAFLAIIFYSAFLLPHQWSLDMIDLEQLEIDMMANRGLMEDALEEQNFRTNNFTGQSTFFISQYHYGYERALYSALQNGDVERYLAVSQLYTPKFHSEEILDHYTSTSLFPGKDMIYDATNSQNRLASYPDSMTMNFSVVQQKTAWQQLQLFFLNWGPTIFILLTLFIGSDVFVQSIKKRTQRIGVPLGWGRYLFIQSLSLLSFVLLFFLAAGALFFVVNGVLHGFGSLDWQVPQFNYSEDFVTNSEVYGLMSIGAFFLQSLPFLLLVLYLFVRLTALFSLLFRQEVVVFLAGAFTFVFERLYFSRTTRDVFGISVADLPQTFFDFGKVITGHKNFLINTGSVTAERGFVMLIIMTVVVELILAFTARHRTRQAFIQ